MRILALIGNLFGTKRQSALSFLFPVGLMLAVLTFFSGCGSNQSSSMPSRSLQGAPLGSEAGMVEAVKSSQKITEQAAPNYTAPKDEELIRAAMAEANRIRRENKLPEFAFDSQIAVAAQRHAVDMERRKYFEHNSPEGESPFDRMHKSGVSFDAAAENIAMGIQEPKTVFALWLKSPGHRKNLLNKNYRRQGIGYFGGYWVHDFAD